MFAQPSPQQRVEDFSALVPAARTVDYPLFSRAIGQAVDQIRGVFGAEDPLVKYLEDYPPLPMMRCDWNHRYATYTPPQPGCAQREIEIRPDLALYPIFLLSVLTHEATHATDPSVSEATRVLAQWRAASVVDPKKQELLLDLSRHGYESEMLATRREIEVLEKLRPPSGLLDEQNAYFQEQQESLLAFRSRVFTTNQVRCALVTLSKSIYELQRECDQKSEPYFAPLDLLASASFGLSQTNPVLTDSWNRSAHELLSLFRPNNRAAGQGAELIQRCVEQANALKELLPRAAQRMVDTEALAAKRHCPPLKIVPER